jgi:thiamine-phosphate diphosphorylase
MHSSPSAIEPLATAPLIALRHRLRGLYVITDEHWANRHTAGRHILDGHAAIARAALKGGAGIIQLRDKSASAAQLLPIARELRRLTRDSGALFILNDRVDMALACDADGVHLGPDDLPLADARRLLGPHLIIGASCGDMEEARRAAPLGADYIGAGAVFATTTKSDAGAPIGLGNLRAITRATNLPVAAIGGIGGSNIAQTVAAGARMACVVSAVSAAGDEAAMTEATRALILAARFE